MAGLLDDTSGFGGLLGNPLFNIGLATLAASAKPGATFGGAVGQGGLLGMQNLQQAQQAAGAAQLRDMQLSEMRRKLDAQAKLAAALKGATQPQNVPGFGGPEVTAFSNQYDPGVMAMPGSVPAPRAFVSSVAGQLSQPQTVAPQPGDILQNPGVRSALFDLDPTAALTAFTKEGAAPKVETRYNPQSGREEKVQWNPATRQWVPLGGTKTDLLSPEAVAQQEAIRRAGKTDVHTIVGQSEFGTIPPGYQLVRDPVTKALSMSPIPGGPVTREQAEKDKKAADAAALAKVGAGIVTEDIDRALKLADDPSIPTTGPLGAALANVPGTSAHNLSATLDAIKANIAFDRLQQMRSASPTGGALGAVSEGEGRLLQAAYGSLLQSQGKDQFKHNLQRVKDLYLDIIHGPGNRPGAKTAQRLRFDAQGNPVQ